MKPCGVVGFVRARGQCESVRIGSCTYPCDLCRRTIYDDPFIRNYIEDLLENIRTQVCTQCTVAALPKNIAGTSKLHSNSLALRTCNMQS